MVWIPLIHYLYFTLHLIPLYVLYDVESEIIEGHEAPFYYYLWWNLVHQVKQDQQAQNKLRLARKWSKCSEPTLCKFLTWSSSSSDILFNLLPYKDDIYHFIVVARVTIGVTREMLLLSSVHQTTAIVAVTKQPLWNWMMD